MNHLISIRTNILYSKIKDGYRKYQEIIFLIDKPIYRLTNDKDIIREREIEELRFTVSEGAFDEMIKSLVQLKDIKEDELTD